jgi:uncharacterized protein (DUF1778 family)
MFTPSDYPLDFLKTQKAQVLLEREARITLSERDFNAFARALDSAFAPNPALKAALAKARRKVRRA